MQALAKAVEKHRSMILEAEQFLWKHPQTGYREFENSQYMEKTLLQFGYELIKAEEIPGFYTQIDTGRPGPEILIFGELDSILCSQHPDADPKTGAVHSCGHHAQCAALLGIAAALKEPGILDQFCGKIRLCAVPAEELLEIEYRSRLKEQGKIRYYSGKAEFLSRGYFDGVDLAFLVHTSSHFSVSAGAVGCMVKKIIYKGVSAHAGGAPWAGCNALYAATCGINAVNAIRETFQEPDLIRVHPIVTHGGDMVNAIPETVRLESYVRGVSFDAICHANQKVNRALCGAALSLGANIDIIDVVGYAPLVNDPSLIQVAQEAIEQILPDVEFSAFPTYDSGSTDLGDLSSLMPVIHPYAGGASGKVHGNNYCISDPESACVSSAKWQLAMLQLLLENDAARARAIIADYRPAFASKTDYLAYLDSLSSSGDRIAYQEDGKAIIRIQ